ncbi:MAG: HpcH/HpaI aldolase/citrate lyase family protein [Alphaproteobacteria bacterium]|nr:HpcH/HpaI aldolase/citrate lyase family protein [Alphaproteobacteria bacterium]
MDMPINAFKQAIRAGKPQIGLWSALSSNYVAEAIAGAGYDWILVDTEHSPNELPMVMGQIQAIAAYPTSAVVRPAWNDAVLIKRFLDIGAQSLLIPFVQDAEEAKRAVRAVRYPPQGIRGVSGTTRANRFGRVPDYFKRANDEVCLLVQIETRTALAELERIAAVDGIDGVFIGPADLSADFGRLGTSGDSEVWSAISEAGRRLRRAGKPAGILAPVEADARRWLDEGFTFVSVGVDLGMLARGADALLKKFRS